MSPPMRLPSMMQVQSGFLPFKILGSTPQVNPASRSRSRTISGCAVQTSGNFLTPFLSPSTAGLRHCAGAAPTARLHRTTVQEVQGLVGERTAAGCRAIGTDAGDQQPLTGGAVTMGLWALEKTGAAAQVSLRGHSCRPAT